ncbi:MAG TPA: Pecanex-like protein 1 [Actinoplanes sp.]
MRRAKYRRGSRSTWFGGRRRIIAAVATLVAFGGIVAVTQVSDASTRRATQRALNACNSLKAPNGSALSTETKRGTWTTNGGTVTQHADDGAGDVATTAEVRRRCREWVLENVGGGSGGGSAQPSPTTSSADTKADDPSTDPSGDPSGDPSASPSESSSAPSEPAPSPSDSQSSAPATPPPGAGLEILTNSCDTSSLAPHDGFQIGDRCVSTEFGEVGVAANNPSLLITRAPRSVAANTAFSITVSTRNLIRDRFLAAGKGGYYIESSVLQNGLTRGHFHTACRMLSTTSAAPDPAPVPAFFVATEDSKGGAEPDTVTINVPGLPTAGLAQCASWAGDGSHRIPMMERANQTPAFDTVRIRVRSGGAADAADAAN